MTRPAQRIIALYQRHARVWAETRHRPYSGRLMEAAWLDRFLALLPARPDVLDIGCGTGRPIGGYLAARGCRLTGVDSAPGMIALCREALPDQTWHIADMRSLALGRGFDGILAWDSFFHLCHDDQRRMFPIFRDHAAHAAALMFTSGPAHGEAIGSFAGEALYHASLDPAEYRDLLNANGFDVVAHIAEDPECGRHTVWLARLR